MPDKSFTNSLLTPGITPSASVSSITCETTPALISLEVVETEAPQGLEAIEALQTKLKVLLS